MARLSPRLILALAAGGWAVTHYFSWWLVARRFANPLLAALLVLALLFVGAQFVGSWVFYWLARRRAVPAPRPHALAVDVFVTVCGEPISLVERALRAALDLHGAHQTYLLDDGGDAACALLCERLGAHYLTRADRTDAKAGNLNAAWPRTTGDVIAIFDVDHVPLPDFLTHTVHHFADARIGFVQVMLTFSNTHESWMARAAAETALDWYNPTSFGMDAAGCASLMGSNAVIRRCALEGIGGYQPGLAEDLATSLALHAAGWRSAYVAEPLAPGLAPATLLAWYTQQLKWARGVFEVLLTALPRAWGRLGWAARLAYVVRTTKYWIGPAVFGHLVLSGGAALFAGPPTRALVQDYLLHLLPLVVCDLWIRREALRLWRHPTVPAIVPLRALALIYFSWPVYTLAWLMAVLRVPLRFQPTPKASGGRLPASWLLPQAVTSLALLAGLWVTSTGQRGLPSYFLELFVGAQMGLQIWLIGSWVAWRWARSRRRAREPAPLCQPADG